MQKMVDHLTVKNFFIFVVVLYLETFSLQQVSWYWKTLTETDSLWMPKCLRYGWFLPFTPSPYEVGVWKRNYIENIKYIHVLRPRVRM